MKKLLLITFLFLITPDAKADMDYICRTTYTDYGLHSLILDICERNNIFHLKMIPEDKLMISIANWCRQDREINYLKLEDENSRYQLTCVLYSKRPRTDALFQ